MEQLTVLVLQGSASAISKQIKALGEVHRVERIPRTVKIIAPTREQVLLRLPTNRQVYTPLEVTHALTGMSVEKINVMDVRRCTSNMWQIADCPLVKLTYRVRWPHVGVTSIYTLKENYDSFAENRVAAMWQIRSAQCFNPVETQGGVETGVS